MKYIISIMAILEIILGSSVFIAFFIKYIKYRAKLTFSLVIYYLLLGMAIVWECLRTIGYAIIPIITIDIDIIISSGKIVFIFIGAFFLCNLSYNYAYKSGVNKKILYKIRILMLFLVPVFSILSIFNIDIVNYPQSDMFYIQLNPIIFLGIFLFYFVVAIIYYTQITNVLFKLKSKKLRNILNIFITLLVFLFFGELFTLVVYHITNNIMSLLVWSVRISFVVILFIFTFKFGEYIEFMGIHNDILVLYLVSKKGFTLFGYDFQNGDMDMVISAKEMILGGMLTATSTFWSKILNTNKKLTTLQFENITARIHFGDYIVGIIFANENLPILEYKLADFVEFVEERHKKTFMAWNGNITNINEDLGLLIMVKKIFFLED